MTIGHALAQDILSIGTLFTLEDRGLELGLAEFLAFKARIIFKAIMDPSFHLSQRIPFLTLVTSGLGLHFFAIPDLSLDAGVLGQIILLFAFLANLSDIALHFEEIIL